MTPDATLVGSPPGHASTGCTYGDNSSDVRRQRSRHALTLESDPRAVHMAAFTRANPSDRSAFDAHYERVRNDPSKALLAIDDDGEFVGTVGSFTMGENGRSRTGSHRRGGVKGSRRRPSVRSLRSSRPDHFMVGWPVTMPRRRGCLLERALSRWAPKRRSRQGLAPRSSSTSIDSIDRRLIPTVNDSWRRRRAFRRPRR
jgi:hypothetical protein